MILAIAVLVVAASLAITALTRKPPAAFTMTRRSTSLDVALPPHEVITRLTAAHPGRLTNASQDPAGGTVMLQSPISAMSWGFYYPVAVTSREHGSRVQVGIRSKLFQAGPVVTRAHRDAVTTIGTWLS
jgi:hypothetical protein